MVLPADRKMYNISKAHGMYGIWFKTTLQMCIINIQKACRINGRLRFLSHIFILFNGLLEKFYLNSFQFIISYSLLDLTAASILKRLFQPVKSFLQQASRAGYIYPLEPFSACAEHRPGVKPKPGFVNNQVVKFLVI